MIKKLLLSAAVTAGFVGTSHAQQQRGSCLTDEMQHLAEQRFPEQTAQSAAKWKQIIDASLSKMNLSQFAKTTFTANDTFTVYHIPLVFHIVHNYGTEFAHVTDNQIYGVVDELNKLYSRENAGIADVITPYKGLIRGTSSRYIGRTQFVFHLAQRDPMGQPTTGINRIRHYLTYKGGDFGKLGGWAPDSYFNIWINKYITNAQAAAYAYKPETVDGNPYLLPLDGVMIAWNPTTQGGAYTINYDNTLGHEIGHSFSLSHVWGNTNNPNIACGDDGILDTPPTKGHKPSSCANTDAINDTTCTTTSVITGEVALDSARRVADASINVGMSFDVYSMLYIDSVSIYQAGDSGTSYAIQIRRNGVQTHLYRDTFRTANKGQKITLPVKFKVSPGMDYTMSFAKNPGVYRDTNAAAVQYQKIGGVVYLKGDGRAQGELYPYFYNWKLRHGYFRILDSATYYSLYVYNNPVMGNSGLPSEAISLPDGGFLVDYPDTVNSQNVMDYTYCSKMFTHGQSVNMRLSASSPLANRNKLSSNANLMAVGVMDASGNILPRQDVRPVADFSVQQYGSTAEQMFAHSYLENPSNPNSRTIVVYNYGEMVYKCLGENFQFINRTTGDTVDATNGIKWDFTNGANVVRNTLNPNVVNVTFSQPGWVTGSLTATSNAGSDTETRRVVYVADNANKIAPIGYWQEFAANADLDRWPVFNYYNNDFKWEVVNNAGLYDQTSMKYNGYDRRYGVTTPVLNLPGSTPEGDFDDFFSPVFDINGLNNGGNLNLNFYSAGASRSSAPLEIRDSLHVYASTDCGNTWKVVGILSKGNLNNNGAVSTPFTPAGMWEWKHQSMDLRPLVNSNTNSIMFRFRYRPGAESNFNGARLGTGNNFYIDRIHVSNNGLGVDDRTLAARGMVLAPNPTTAGTSILLQNATGNVEVTITDVTGKIIYRATATGTGANTTIDIPASAVAVKGIYFVQVATSDLRQTEKLVVN